MRSNKLVRESGRINAEGCKIKIPTPWNVDLFEELLTGYSDQKIVDYIRYGWPLDVRHVEADHDKPLRNQAGARCNLLKVNKYLIDEIGRWGVIGLFDGNPLGEGARFSPLDAIPKKDSEELRIIMNLSFPHDDTSVNANVNMESYFGDLIALKYPNLDDLVRLVQNKDRGALLFKHDLLKFYRQIYMDPGSIHLLGFMVDGSLYFDVVLTMGLRIACYICQRITNAIIFIYKRLSFEGVNYLDNLGGADVKERAWLAFRMLGELLNKLGVWEALSKTAPPSTIMVFLGVLCNSEACTLSITLDRLLEIQGLIEKWRKRRSATLRDVQSLAGKLNFVCLTVRAGRVFVSRILTFFT